MMRIFRAALVGILVLSSLGLPAQALDDDKRLGRWQMSAGDPDPVADFTLDIVPCGDDVCGIRVDKGRCNGVVLKSGAAPGGDGMSPQSPGSPKGSEYWYTRDDLKEKFLVILGVSDVANDVGGTGKPDLVLSGVPVRLPGIAESGKGWFPLKELFHRTGDAKCTIPEPIP